MAPHLLTIPIEVRLNILKELLYRREGVHFRSKRLQKGPKNAPSVQPQILVCCRQLLQEGKPLFQSNRLILTIGVWGYAGFVETNVYDKLPCGFHKVQITLDIGEDRDLLGDYGWDPLSDSDYGLVHEVVGMLRASRECTDLHVHLRDMACENAGSIDYIEPLMTQLQNFDGLHDAYELLMNPFRLLRGLKHVEFTEHGFPEYIEKLVNEMTGNSKVVDLPAMYYALCDWGVANDPSFFDQFDSVLEQAEIAAFTMDSESFYSYRRSIVQEIYNRFATDRQSIYKDDPDPLSAMYKALEDDTEMADFKQCRIASYHEPKDSESEYRITRLRLRP
jgi:hypothetical protein